MVAELVLKPGLNFHSQQMRLFRLTRKNEPRTKAGFLSCFCWLSSSKPQRRSPLPVFFCLFFCSKPGGWELLFVGLPNLTLRARPPKRRRRRTSRLRPRPRLRLPRLAWACRISSALPSTTSRPLGFSPAGGARNETTPQKKKNEMVVFSFWVSLGMPPARGSPHEKHKTQRSGVCSGVGRSNSAWPARGQRRGTRKSMGPRLQQTNSCLDVCCLSFLCFLF